MAKINHHSFRRRSADLHIAALLQVRREHGHNSFFDEHGYVRNYATAYLQRWLASDWPAEMAAGIPNLHRDDNGHMIGLEAPTQGTEQHAYQRAMAHRFLDILSILDSEDVALYADDHDEAHEAQMAELSQTYTLIDHPNWDRGHGVDAENVVYLR